jgi:23S rRNA (adenine1618-N6)-methyltransferase
MDSASPTVMTRKLSLSLCAFSCAASKALLVTIDIKLGYSNHYLCPPFLEETDYIHYIADLLASSNNGIIPKHAVQGLDIGVGANCIYPIMVMQNTAGVFVNDEKKAIENCSTIMKPIKIS